MHATTIGDYKDGGPAFVKWVAAVKAVGGSPTAWPFTAGMYAKYQGRPAAKYTPAVYAKRANARQLPDVTAPTQSLGTVAIYVLAANDVAADAPEAQMTAWQRIENAAFTHGDQAAGALGLPSLAGLEKNLILILALVGVGLYFFLRPRGGRPSTDWR